MANARLTLKSGFPRAPLSNGIGRYVGQLQRVTLKFCKSHGSSKGMRDFIEKDLVSFAEENPGVVVYVKPRRHRSPVIKAEYLNGKDCWIGCRKFTRDDIIKYLELVKTQASDGTQFRLRKFWHTEFPSIQGPWTPFTFMNPKLNITEFPDEEIGACPKLETTATEEIIKLFKEQRIHEKEYHEEVGKCKDRIEENEKISNS